MFRLPALLALTLLAGCATTEVTKTYTTSNGTPVTETRKGGAATYGIYTDTVKALAQAHQQERPITIDDACARGDSVCVVAVAGFLAVAAQANAANQHVEVQAPARERDGAEKFRDVALGLTALAVPLANTYQNVVLAKTNRDRDRELYGTFARIVESNNGVTRDLANAAPGIVVSGDYVTGQVGDNITGNGNATAHDTGSANSGTQVAGDLTGRDHNDGAVVGTGNRVGSPSFDNVGNGGSCAGGNGGTGGAGAEGSNGGAGGVGAGGGNCTGNGTDGG
jgi:hypothetical protein